MESQAIVQITIYLVNIGADPFNYRFPISEPVIEVRKEVATVLNEAKDIYMKVPESENQETLEVTASGAVDGVSEFV